MTSFEAGKKFRSKCSDSGYKCLCPEPDRFALLCNNHVYIMVEVTTALVFRMDFGSKLDPVEFERGSRLYRIVAKDNTSFLELHVPMETVNKPSRYIGYEIEHFLETHKLIEELAASSNQEENHGRETPADH